MRIAAGNRDAARGPGPFRKAGRYLAVFTVCTVFPLAGCQMPDSMRTDPVKAVIDARAALLQAAEEKDPLIRSRAIEALGQALGNEAGAVFVQGLKDRYAVVCFASAMAIGATRYAPALPDLLKMAGDGQTERNVLCSVIYALYRIGDEKNCFRLAELLFDSDKSVRSNAAMVMGLMGNGSAIPLLRDLLRDEKEPVVRLNAVEALALLGDSASAELLEAFAKGTFMDDKLLAIPILARVRGAHAAEVLRGLAESKNPPPVRVSAAGMLSKIGESADGGYEFCIRCVRDPAGALEKSSGKVRPDDPAAASLQRLAAMSLGWMKRQQAVDCLTPLLASRDGSVRVAAAMSILTILADRLRHGGPQQPDKTGQNGRDVKHETDLPSTMQTSGGKD
ncbi:MAG: HEAT repeat domain-containing protein [Planctomycetes bacterium]|nr:HEAT repeat domain-containing protein [Planctomycetota bacterium]